MDNKMTDLVNHPPHYKSLGARCVECNNAIECIDVTEHFNFNLGNAIKYIWRCDHKEAPLKDLEKAVWYIQREISLRAKEITPKNGIKIKLTHGETPETPNHCLCGSRLELIKGKWGCPNDN